MKRNFLISGLFTLLIIASLILIFNMNINYKKQVIEGNEINFKDIDSKKLKIMMANKDFKLINVHVPYVGDIENTDLSIPYNKIGKLINLPKDEKIVLYCRSGSMSKTAAENLVKLGYTNVYNLQYGMNEWTKEGNKLMIIKI